MPEENGEEPEELTAGGTTRTMDDVDVGRELLNVPFPEMVLSMGKGIASAQLELDRMGLQVAQMMSGQPFEGNSSGVKIKFGKKSDGVTDREYSLMELGFTPHFYQFVDTIIEVKMSISMSYSESSRTSETTVSGQAGGFMLGPIMGGAMKVSTVSASFSQKFSYSAEGSSLLRTKLVPIPPPPVLEERIRQLLADAKTASGG